MRARPKSKRTEKVLGTVNHVQWSLTPFSPADAIPDLVPDLGVEVSSKHNTRHEMDCKLQNYFAAGVRLVWYVYRTPRREVWVYQSPTV
jgi:Uma2 family endonuclease